MGNADALRGTHDGRDDRERPTLDGPGTLTAWLRDGRVILTREVSMAVVSECAGVAMLEAFRRHGDGSHRRIAGFNLADVVFWSLEPPGVGRSLEVAAARSPQGASNPEETKA